MKLVITRSLIGAIGLSFATLGYAAAQPSLQSPEGFYIGAQLGGSETHYGLSDFNTTKTVANGTVTSTGFGQRGLLGYRFNHYFAAEAGYAHYGTTTGDSLTYTGAGTTSYSGNITEDSFDVYAKGILPLANEIDVYGKLGVAAISADFKSTEGNYSKSRSATRPAFAAGATYNVTNHFAVDASYNRVQGDGKIASADLFAVGFYYYF